MNVLKQIGLSAFFRRITILLAEPTRKAGY
jgi:hypothetical protein